MAIVPFLGVLRLGLQDPGSRQRDASRGVSLRARSKRTRSQTFERRIALTYGSTARTGSESGDFTSSLPGPARV